MSKALGALTRPARLLLLGGLIGLGAGHLRAEEGPAVAAAASLRPALDAIAKGFEKDSRQGVRITYGATGTLVHQIDNGAPFQMLLAADDESVNNLAAAGRTDGAPIIFARGQLSLVAPKGSPVTVDGELNGLKEALAGGKVIHFAIANPDVAPYGRAAREALQRSGLWSAIEPRLVIGENVGQAAQFASSGAAEAGLIAESLAISAELAPRITAAVVPETWHAPIDQGMALIKGAGPTARAFADFVRGPKGREALESNGFSVPGQ
jgi:molybdate transport system substrate-binding protein